MTPEEAEETFSAAYDGLLDESTQRAFEATLAEHPELAEQYAEFCRTLSALKDLHADSDIPAPDLLGGVQRRLRDKSGGRYYVDRFAERSGWGAKQLFVSLLAFVLFLTLFWSISAVVSSVQLTP